MQELNNIRENIFESIKHIDEEGNEYWYARELMNVLEYKDYRFFKKVINKSIESCVNSFQNEYYHFVQVHDMIIIGKGGKRKVENYKLSRYACYLIAQNGDSRKEVIALAQTYFSIQTRKMELLEEEYEKLSEDEKRLYRRKITKDQNKILYGIAKSKGVKNYDRFTNAGYKGLYNGETADDIAKRKNLDIEKKY